MPFQYYWEDLVPGAEWKLGNYFLTQTDLIEFAKRFDPQPFHVDPEKAKESALGRLCASGSHTFVLVQRLTFDALYSKAATIAGMGVDKVRFIRPLLPDETMSGSAKVLSRLAHPVKPDRGIVVIGSTATDPRGDCVATMETTFQVFRRAPATS
jgi:acyl dehydratase